MHLNVGCQNAERYTLSCVVCSTDRFPIKWVVVVTIAISIIGHGLYVFCANVSNPVDAACAIIVARSIVGLGSGELCLEVLPRSTGMLGPLRTTRLLLIAGVLGLCRSVISLVTLPPQRTPWFSALSTAKFVG